MASGTALTDLERWDFFTAVRERAISALQQDTHPAAVVFLACSVQEKKKYRDVLRVALLEDQNLRMTFVHLKVEDEIVMQRVKNRQGHFIDKDMVCRQIRNQGIPPPPDGEDDVIIVDGGGSTEVIAEEVVARLKSMGSLPCEENGVPEPEVV